MEITYRNILDKVESGEIELLEGIVKNKLGKEYKMRDLEQVSIIGTIRARKSKIPLKLMKYRPSGKDVTVFSETEMSMEVYIRVLDVKDGELCTKDIYFGDFTVENIANGLEKFKKMLSYSKNIAYSRLQTAKKVEDIESCLKVSHNLPDVVDLKELKRIAEEENEGITQTFNNINLYEQLEKYAKEVFAN